MRSNLEHAVELHPSMTDVEEREENVETTKIANQTPANFSMRFSQRRRRRRRRRLEQVPVDVEPHRLRQVPTQIKRREAVEVLGDVTNRRHVERRRTPFHFFGLCFFLLQSVTTHEIQV